MKQVNVLLILLFLLALSSPCRAGFFQDLFKGFKGDTSAPKEATPDSSTIAAGLKEALAVGTRNAVSSVGKTDGYFGNLAIKILLPEKIRGIAELLASVGFRKEVDDFELSMNRAAEKAAPQAAGFFADALKEMTFDDAVGIWKGGNTSATEYFRRKTREPIFKAFRPIVAESVNKVGVTRSYKELVDKYESFTFMKSESLDLDTYVTNKALDGLFYMLGEEEKKIRTDPAARVTELLKKVFGK